MLGSTEILKESEKVVRCVVTQSKTNKQSSNLYYTKRKFTMLV
jgi:hypothetical protein